MAAALSLADLRGTARLWHQRRTEWSISLTAFLGVALLGVLPGIALAVVLSILNVFRHAWWPYQAQLGRVEGIPGYHDITRHPRTELLDGLVLYRFDAPLFFANARSFREEIRRIAGADPRPRWVVVAAEPVTDVDVTAADVLEELDAYLSERGTTLVFAELKTPVRLKLEHYRLTRPLGPEHFFPTLDAAVEAFRAQNGGNWHAPHDSSE